MKFRHGFAALLFGLALWAGDGFSAQGDPPKRPAGDGDEPPELPRAKLEDGVFLQSGDLKVMNAHVERVLLLMLTDEKRKNPRNVPSEDRIFQARILIAQRLLEVALIEQYARDRKLESTKEDLDRFIDMKKAALQRENSSYEQMLADSGQTDAEFRSYWGAMIAIERDVAAKLSTAEVEAYFAKHKDELPLRSAAHILFQFKGAHQADDTVTRTKEEAKKLAEDTLKQLKEGKDFAELVKNSDDDATKTKGGNMPFYPLRGKDTFYADTFGKAVYALKNVGDLGPVVQSQYGFHVIKLTGLRDEEFKLDMRRYLAKQKFDQMKSELMMKTLEAAKFNEKLTALPGRN